MSERKFRFGVSGRGETQKDWCEFARKAEGLGYQSFDIPDHFTRQYSPIPALAAAAQVTSTIRLATTMLCNDFRHPIMLAKEAATLDVLSNGRFELGIGTGSRPEDLVEAGMTEDSAGVKVERVEENRVRVDATAGEALDRGDQVRRDPLRHEARRVVGRGIHRPRVPTRGHRDARHRLDAPGQEQVLPPGAQPGGGLVDRLES